MLACLIFISTNVSRNHPLFYSDIQLLCGSDVVQEHFYVTAWGGFS